LRESFLDLWDSSILYGMMANGFSREITTAVAVLIVGLAVP
jgi:hypothetical protein